MLSAAILDPEKLLWVPGQKLISIPKPRWRAFINGIEIEVTPQCRTAYVEAGKSRLRVYDKDGKPLACLKAEDGTLVSQRDYPLLPFHSVIKLQDGKKEYLRGWSA